MTIGDLYTLNLNSNFDFIEIWESGHARILLEQTRMNSLHLAWYDWQISYFLP